MEYRTAEKISDKDREEILHGLIEYNMARIEDKNPRELGIYLEDEQGRKRAGLIGETHGSWLTVSLLWVAEELRGQGVGRDILRRAEAEARRRGCKYAFLDTFGFQAPGFYEKQGYTPVLTLREYPLTGTRRYFTKEL